jgi:hypothetical protein
MSFGKYIFCGSQYVEYPTLDSACYCIDTGITANTALNFITTRTLFITLRLARLTQLDQYRGDSQTDMCATAH